MSRTPYRRDLLICLFIALAAVAVYLPVGGHGFVNFDDPMYITENARVLQGLSLENVIWAFSAFHAGNWHPLTWISHMLDVSLFGMNAGGHHATSLVLHVLNSLLLFALFRKMTGVIWQSAFVAVLFAIHPLHVESVAWASERKDVLSTFFGFLALLSYAWYASHGARSYYLAALLFFVLGLMAKPMLVTIPFVMLLLDGWPLRRIGWTRRTGSVSPDPADTSVLGLVVEKAPFFFFAAASSVVTFYAQQHGGAVAPLEMFSLGARIGNALVAYVSYIGKMFWPAGLSAFNPHPQLLPAWQVAGSCLVLAGISMLCVAAARQRPYLPAGWLFYLGTLVPVIGIVQVGEQAMADRYTYIPSIGISIMLAWGLPDLLAKWQYRRVGLVIGSFILVIALVAAARLQLRHWSDIISFNRHMIEMTADNYVAHYNLGVYLAETGQIDASIEHYREAIRIKPNHANANNNLGNELVKKGRPEEAVPYFRNALRRSSRDPEIHNNFGVALALAGETDRAIDHFETALKIRPNYPEARKNLQKALGEGR